MTARKPALIKPLAYARWHRRRHFLLREYRAAIDANPEVTVLGMESPYETLAKVRALAHRVINEARNQPIDGNRARIARTDDRADVGHWILDILDDAGLERKGGHMTATQEAIAAAAEALAYHRGDSPAVWMQDAKTAVEAAAPLIAAAAWREGYGQGRDDEAAAEPMRDPP